MATQAGRSQKSGPHTTRRAPRDHGAHSTDRRPKWEYSGAQSPKPQSMKAVCSRQQTQAEPDCVPGHTTDSLLSISGNHRYGVNSVIGYLHKAQNVPS